VKRAEKYDLITMMNVLNEVDESVDTMLIDTLRALLADGGAVIMIEPSTREQSRRALRFRDRLVENGMHIYAPCTRKGNCPALVEEDDWCHTEVRWQRPNFIKAIDDLAGTLRLSLKSTYAVALSEDRNLADVKLGCRDFLTAGRIVSEVADEKGRVRMTICNDRGKPEYVLNKRDKSETNATVRSAKRYDLVTIEAIEIREHDVKIGGETVFNIESGPDGCGYVDN
jgi:ribosomal protein RSM22 (predicted rRNA methylase)